jgi:hypothetical protein
MNSMIHKINNKIIIKKCWQTNWNSV